MTKPDLDPHCDKGDSIYYCPGGGGGYKFGGEGHKIWGAKKGEGHKICTIPEGEGHKFIGLYYGSSPLLRIQEDNRTNLQIFRRYAAYLPKIDIKVPLNDSSVSLILKDSKMYTVKLTLSSQNLFLCFKLDRGGS